MRARLERLTADYKKIMEYFDGHPNISVEPIDGNPPFWYKVVYMVNGIQELGTDQHPVISDYHIASIYLGLEYPRQKPVCMLKTPIWHPNFDSSVCISSHWQPDETIIDIICTIGDMIQYRSYDLKSPLNKTAAKWAKKHWRELPVGNIDLHDLKKESN